MHLFKRSVYCGHSSNVSGRMPSNATSYRRSSVSSRQCFTSAPPHASLSSSLSLLFLSLPLSVVISPNDNHPLTHYLSILSLSLSLSLLDRAHPGMLAMECVLPGYKASQILCKLRMMAAISGTHLLVAVALLRSDGVVCISPQSRQTHSPFHQSIQPTHDHTFWIIHHAFFIIP